VSFRIVGRTLAALAAGAVVAVPGLVPAAPALAHGATTEPISRTAACAGDGDRADGAACRAALAANGGPFGSFDNLRVPGVNGKDRKVVPDGRLCSGGLNAFRGLDLARADWPATRLTAGDRLDVRYRTTIPHDGTFRVYLTRPRYRPDRPLRWADLGREPIFTATDPPLRDGAYRFGGRIPADRTGRHLLYVVWQTTSTPDTYYSCSDLILRAPAAAAKPAATPTPTKKAKAKKAKKAKATPAASSSAVPLAPVSDVITDDSGVDRRIVVGTLVVAAVVAGAVTAVRFWRRPRRRGDHRGPRIG
jgi:predicted carbohydrate-binding protein with CBM5 and CBM33 domain